MSVIDIAASASRRSSTLRAIGPVLDISCGPMPRSGDDALYAGTRPKLGRNPWMPQAYAG
jgi:hypothetical protein